MLPEEFLQRLKDQKYVDSGSLLKALDKPSPVSIRINPSKWNNTPSDSEPVPWCRHGFYLQSRPSYTSDPLFHSGCYYPQEASGMFLEQVIRQSAGSPGNLHVLDLCGAPGGKSTHLSELIGKSSLLVANEVIRSRAAILAETLTKWGSGNTMVTQNDPSAFGKLSGFFDIILVDAPCSGEGMFRTDVAVNEWSVENTAHCSERQKRILMNIWPALKENGILIYSTCTFNPGENEKNIKWLIGKHEAEIVKLNIEEFIGITEIDYQGIYGYGFYPGRVRGEGFFISVVRKRGKQEESNVIKHKKNDLKPLKSDFAVAEEWTIFSKDRLLKWHDELFYTPTGIDTYFYLFNNLKIVKTGTKIYVVKKNDYLPSHELALSVQLKRGAFPAGEVNHSEAVSYLKRDNFKLNIVSLGWNIVTYRGVRLGFLNNIGSRVNNYYPVDWRIRMNITEQNMQNVLKWGNNGSNIA
jgi:16S rRNA C967 or C1407 C5-methylase (RsmB/RsmF family)/NOL1/NOP2/fmu family ribosome biogenesis protein